MFSAAMDPNSYSPWRTFRTILALNSGVYFPRDIVWTPSVSLVQFYYVHDSIVMVMPMKKCCDYDSIVLYQPGQFNSKYKTILAGKLIEIGRYDFDAKITSSFQNQNYGTFRTLEPIILYRVFGQYDGIDEKNSPKGARLKGAFASTEFAESIIDAKVRLALDPAWFNTKMYEAQILVPRNVEISVGIVAQVQLNSGTVLSGGADQILLPREWSDSWIMGYRRVTTRQLQAKPMFVKEKIGEHDTKGKVYRTQCPLCGSEDVKKLPASEQFVFIGSKGNEYTMQYACQNPSCLYFW